MPKELYSLASGPNPLHSYLGHYASCGIPQFHTLRCDHRSLIERQSTGITIMAKLLTVLVVKNVQEFMKKQSAQRPDIIYPGPRSRRPYILARFNNGTWRISWPCARTNCNPIKTIISVVIREGHICRVELAWSILDTDIKEFRRIITLICKSLAAVE